MKRKMDFDSIMTEFEPITESASQQEVNGGAIRPMPTYVVKYGVFPTKTPKPTVTAVPTKKPPITMKYGIRPSTAPM